jgi:hypothetical protein
MYDDIGVVIVNQGVDIFRVYGMYLRIVSSTCVSILTSHISVVIVELSSIAYGVQKIVGLSWHKVWSLMEFRGSVSVSAEIIRKSWRIADEI